MKFKLDELKIQSFITKENGNAIKTIKGGALVDDTGQDESGRHTCHSHFYTDCVFQTNLICPKN